MANSQTNWGSSTSFIFAASAAAIGLGNIWRFPYMAGEHGGAVFVLIYLACVLILGIPLLFAEVVLGRLGQKNPVASIANIATQSNRTTRWAWLGGLNMMAGFLILTYYVVIVGWVLDYLGRAIIGQFHHITESGALKDFTELQTSHWQMLTTDTMVVLGAIVLITLGVKRGLERSIMIMFPALLILLIALLGYAMTTGSFMHSVVFLFKPEMHEVTSKTILLALGQAFFSLNIAMGVTIMFSAYLPKGIPLMKSVIAITLADTGVAILSGLVIFPIVFANHLQPSAGPSLIFKTIPLAFGNMPFGTTIAILFFLMLFFAAFSSVVAVFEPTVCWLMETWRISRYKAVMISGIIIWLLSLAAIASFSHGKHMQLLGVTYFKAIDYLTANIMLPVGGLLLALFTGWFIPKKLICSELSWTTETLWFKAWHVVLRYVAPIGIILILLAAVGII